MIALATALLAFPIGMLVKERLAAYVVYLAIYTQLFVFQTSYLLRQWSGGDHSAFPKDPDNIGVGYLVVTSVIYIVGFLLVTLGHRVGAKRRARRAN